LKATESCTRFDLPQFYFTIRVISRPIWNSLPNHVVSAESVNILKTRLGNFWSNHKMNHTEI